MGRYGTVKLCEQSLPFTKESDVCQAPSNLSDTAGGQGQSKATQPQSSLSLATQGK